MRPTLLLGGSILSIAESVAAMSAGLQALKYLPGATPAP